MTKKDSLELFRDSTTNVRVSFARNYEIKRTEEAELILLLEGVNSTIRMQIDKIRGLYVTDPEKGKELKKNLPIYYVSGVYGMSKALQNLTKFSGRMCLDFDGNDNPDLDTDTMKAIICTRPYVEYCGLSVSGRGVFAVIRVPDAVLDKRVFARCYNSLKAEFAADGLFIDPAANRLNQGRFVSYDNNPYWNYGATEYVISEENESSATSRSIEAEKPLPHSRYKSREQHPAQRENTTYNYEKVDTVICTATTRGCVIAPTFDDWYRCGCGIANTFGEKGRLLFRQLCTNWEAITCRTQDVDPDVMYNECLEVWRTAKSGCRDVIGIVLSKAKKCGIYYKDNN